MMSSDVLRYICHGISLGLMMKHGITWCYTSFLYITWSPFRVYWYLTMSWCLMMSLDVFWHLSMFHVVYHEISWRITKSDGVAKRIREIWETTGTRKTQRKKRGVGIKFVQLYPASLVHQKVDKPYETNWGTSQELQQLTTFYQNAVWERD